MRLIDADALTNKLDEMISKAILADTKIHYALIRELVSEQPTIEPEVHTNGDRIRNMTDEALVGIVFKKVCEIIRPDGDCKGVYFGNCEKCVLQWLKQEVIEDVGTD